MKHVLYAIEFSFTVKPQIEIFPKMHASNMVFSTSTFVTDLKKIL